MSGNPKKFLCIIHTRSFNKNLISNLYRKRGKERYKGTNNGESPIAASQRKRKIREEKRPACEICRSLKLKCDAFLDYTRPCSRCLKREIECIVLEERRKRSPSVVDSGLSTNILGMSLDPQLVLDHHTSSPTSCQQPLITRPDELPRVINGIEVSGHLVDTCFNLFNYHYGPIIPILSSVPTPERTYRESELKFWVIVAIGSRRCTQDPTLFSQLSTHVENLAISSLRLTNSPYPVIEALLLMCTWPLSYDQPFFSSIYLTIGNTVLPLALQAGLHQCCGLRPTFRNGDPQADLDGTRGIKLWAYACIIAQSAMLTSGLTCIDLSTMKHLLQGSECCAGLPNWILHRGRIMASVARAQQAASELGIEHDEQSKNNALITLVSVVEFELSAQASISQTDESPDTIHLTKLLISSISVISMVNQLDVTTHLSQYCPDYIFQAIVVAASVVLKIVKGFPPRGIDISGGRAALFSAISLFKSMSILNDDVPARVAHVFTKLWASNKVYRNSNGEIDCLLRIRNRLIVGVAYDSFWWYREVVTGWLEHIARQYTSSTGSLDEAPTQTSVSDEFFGFWAFDWATAIPSTTSGNSAYTPTPEQS
ncbi:hypothetical protein BX600DRAFT_525197 [Xylariales sp. PMI_506]|nr:hypothetical protein BX600DRAFT_525197 [Xylariales sp. PMI_506]